MSLPNDLTSYTATLIRLGRGVFPRVTAERRRDPARLLELYDFEACPYCRKVREVLSELDLDYRVHPVAQGSGRRAELVRRGGKMQAPYLVDPNTGTELYESDDIIRYLNATYGEGEQAGWRLPVPAILDDVNSTLASAVRFGRGSRCRRGGLRETFEPLTLFNMEGSPYCRKVRETLSELDLEYVVRNLPKGSPKRAELTRRGGKMQVPYLIDPNTRREMYESDDIIAYLEGQYA
ncbi:MAG TPA: glutathione S-transferase N-terminal domain-containing protein [Candidatus Binatus sp.]|jgi:glutathione S-transferase|nr:glutathione S-transferase N-terminal domain-containing protein [Candidatus Binatus sp.]